MTDAQIYSAAFTLVNCSGQPANIVHRKAANITEAVRSDPSLFNIFKESVRDDYEVMYGNGTNEVHGVLAK